MADRRDSRSYDSRNRYYPSGRDSNRDRRDSRDDRDYRRSSVHDRNRESRRDDDISRSSSRDGRQPESSPRSDEPRSGDRSLNRPPAGSGVPSSIEKAARKDLFRTFKEFQDIAVQHTIYKREYDRLKMDATRQRKAFEDFKATPGAPLSDLPSYLETFTRRKKEIDGALKAQESKMSTNQDTQFALMEKFLATLLAVLHEKRTDQSAPIKQAEPEVIQQLARDLQQQKEESDRKLQRQTEELNQKIQALGKLIPTPGSQQPSTLDPRIQELIKKSELANIRHQETIEKVRMLEQKVETIKLESEHAMTQQASEANEKISALEKEVEKQAQEADQKFNRAVEETYKIGQKARALEQLVQDTDRKNSDLEQQLQKAKLSSDRAVADTDTLKQTMIELRNSHASLASESGGYRDDIAKLQGDLSALISKTRNSASGVDEMSSKLTTDEAEIAAIQEKITSLVSVHDNFQMRLEERLLQLTVVKNGQSGPDVGQADHKSDETPKWLTAKQNDLQSLGADDKTDPYLAQIKHELMAKLKDYVDKTRRKDFAVLEKLILGTEETLLESLESNTEAVANLETQVMLLKDDKAKLGARIDAITAQLGTGATSPSALVPSPHLASLEQRMTNVERECNAPRGSSSIVHLPNGTSFDIDQRLGEIQNLVRQLFSRLEVVDFEHRVLTDNYANINTQGLVNAISSRLHSLDHRLAQRVDQLEVEVHDTRNDVQTLKEVNGMLRTIPRKRPASPMTDQRLKGPASQRPRIEGFDDLRQSLKPSRGRDPSQSRA